MHPPNNYSTCASVSVLVNIYLISPQYAGGMNKWILNVNQLSNMTRKCVVSLLQSCFLPKRVKCTSLLCDSGALNLSLDHVIWISWKRHCTRKQFCIWQNMMMMMMTVIFAPKVNRRIKMVLRNPCNICHALWDSVSIFGLNELIVYISVFIEYKKWVSFRLSNFVLQYFAWQTNQFLIF